MKKNWKVVFVLLALVMGLSACGPKEAAPAVSALPTPLIDMGDGEAPPAAPEVAFPGLTDDPAQVEPALDPGLFPGAQTGGDAGYPTEMELPPADVSQGGLPGQDAEQPQFYGETQSSGVCDEVYGLSGQQTCVFRDYTGDVGFAVLPGRPSCQSVFQQEVQIYTQFDMRYRVTTSWVKFAPDMPGPWSAAQQAALKDENITSDSVVRITTGGMTYNIAVIRGQGVCLMGMEPH
ncbi:hypothetical protein KKD84_05515 [Patescibacteria group bacterium]|nr:hypothetical protein [Patescibacteria group bacterium]